MFVRQETEGRQVLDRQGPQQAGHPVVRHSGQHLRERRIRRGGRRRTGR